MYIVHLLTYWTEGQIWHDITGLLHTSTPPHLGGKVDGKMLHIRSVNQLAHKYSIQYIHTHIHVDLQAYIWYLSTFPYIGIKWLLIAQKCLLDFCSSSIYLDDILFDQSNILMQYISLLLKYQTKWLTIGLGYHMNIFLYIYSIFSPIQWCNL